MCSAMAQQAETSLFDWNFNVCSVVDEFDYGQVDGKYDQCFDFAQSFFPPECEFWRNWSGESHGLV